MSTSAQSNVDYSNDDYVIHLANALLQEYGGEVDASVVANLTPEYVDLQGGETSKLAREIIDSDSRIIVDTSQQEDTIVGVDPTGTPPQQILEEFPSLDPDNAFFGAISVVTDTIANSLEDAGFETYSDLASADPEELQDVSATMTAAKANAIIDEASRYTDSSARLASIGLEQYSDSGPGSAESNVQDVSQIDMEIGDPVAITRDLPADSPDAHVHGLKVHEDIGHPKVPKPETEAGNGNVSLPADENGDVIEPAIPVEPTLQMPIDEAVAKTLARNNRPVMLKGPHGSGKNTVIKWLAHQTNRAYISIDAHEDMLAQDLFGSMSLDEDRKVVRRDTALTAGMKMGAFIVINELPAAQAGILMSLHRFLQEGQLLIKETGELIEPHEATRILATQNPATRGYAGNSELNMATDDRWDTFEHTYPSKQKEVRILDDLINRRHSIVGKKTLEKMVEIAHLTRKEHERDLPTVSTRHLKAAGFKIDDGASPKAAMKWALKSMSQETHRPEEVYGEINDLL